MYQRVNRLGMGSLGALVSWWFIVFFGIGPLGALVSWWFGLISNSKGRRAVRAFRILVEAVK